MRTDEIITCPHTLRVLEKAGVTTMEQLAGMSREELLKLRGIGKVIAGDVLEKVAEWRADPEGARARGGNPSCGKR